MARPQSKPYGELILPVFTQWEKVGSLTGILQSLESGNFYSASLLVDQMMRDDRIRAVMNVRFHSVLGMPMHMESAADTKKADRIAEDCEELWSHIAPRSELVTLLLYGLMLGVCVARKQWDRVDGEWVPTIRTWHPGALWFNLATDEYNLNTREGVIPIRKGDPNWLLFTPYGHKYARIQGLLRSMAMVYLCRQWAFRDRARHSERHGMPFLQLIMPAEADQKDKATARQAIAALGTETVSVTPQGTDGNKFDWKLIEAASDGHKTFGAQIDHLDDAVAILALGQSMSTKGQGGLGSQEKAGDTVRRDIMRFDAGCLSDVGADLLSDFALFNYGSADLAPEPCYEIDPPEDGFKKAQEAATLAQAAPVLARYGVDVGKMFEAAGLPMLTAEQFAKQQQEANETPADEVTETKNDGDDDENASDTQAATA